jgi:class 3 adenylate cyclase/tetratricopeptide (TPR) repeat protein
VHRKVVTVVFCDVVGSTALGESVDPEALQALLGRYFERMKGIVESHGGSVEKFIGDAVMAVFGVPAVHEDDALRAVRAAAEMRAAFPELGVQGRIGVNTGEVVTGTEERLATGDAVNVAARLQQAAEPDEVLIGEATEQLVRGAVEAEPVEPLEVKGKAEPVRAYRLAAVLDAPERAHDAPFVGRAREVAVIREAWKRASAEGRCELVTVVGDAGVGKSRLVAEALAPLGAKIVRGRCLPYGEGITYWPVVEVAKQLAALPADPAAAAAIRSLLGESEVTADREEVSWAFRKLLEEQAPLVVVLDDLHWGDETLYDLVEGIGLLSAGAPLLLVCMARPEFLTRREGWDASVRLEPLPGEAVDELLAELPAVMRERIAVSAGGNPLFLTEMLAMAQGDGDVEVPPTLRALLAARLDQLEVRERHVLERGAVEGEIFHRGAVQALATEEQVTPRLAALVRRQLIRPDRAQLPGEDGFRFRHLLIRDAAYDALPKSTRADLHERFADWLEAHGAGLVELDEILGYHLEQAALYRAELGQPDERLALRAGSRLEAAGRRYLVPGDEPLGARLLERSLVLTRPYRLDVDLELVFSAALHVEEPARAVDVVNAAAERARAAGDEPREAAARVVAHLHRMFIDPEPDPDGLERLALAARALLEEDGDDAILVHVWVALGYGVANARGRMEDWANAAEQAIRHAQAAGVWTRDMFGLLAALAWGPRPADDALRTLDELLPTPHKPLATLIRAYLIGSLGRFDEAWALALPAAARLAEAGDHRQPEWLADLAALDGDFEGAARHAEKGVAAMRTLGHAAFEASYGARLGRWLCMVGRYDEAEPLADFARRTEVQEAAYMWRQVQARVLAHRGKLEEAEQLAREAIALLEETDMLAMQGDGYVDLADVLLGAGRTGEAADALEQALDRYERKKNLAMAAQVRPKLEALRSSAAAG